MCDRSILHGLQYWKACEFNMWVRLELLAQLGSYSSKTIYLQIIQSRLTSDTTLDGNGIAAIYQKRWNVEPYHKSLKQNSSLEKSPTQTVVTQTNHLFAALCGYIKLELPKGDTQLNYFALKSKLYLSAIQSAFAALRELHPSQLAA